MTMARQTRADDGAFEDVQRGKQRGRTVPFVVVGHRARPAGLHRQPGLRPPQRLDLALFVDTEDQGLFGRIHVKTDDVGELFDEPRVGRQLERAKSGESTPGSALVRQPSCADSSEPPAAARCATWPPRPAAHGSERLVPRTRIGGATTARCPGSCRAVERCACSAACQPQATRSGSAIPRAARSYPLESSVPTSRVVPSSSAKLGLGSCVARYQTPGWKYNDVSRSLH